MRTDAKNQADSELDKLLFFQHAPLTRVMPHQSSDIDSIAAELDLRREYPQQRGAVGDTDI